MSLLDAIVIKRVANAVAQPPHSASAYPQGHVPGSSSSNLQVYPPTLPPRPNSAPYGSYEYDEYAPEPPAYTPAPPPPLPQRYAPPPQQQLYAPPLPPRTAPAGPLSRPLVLPQTSHSSQAPFVRGYSSELAVSGIPLDEWIGFVDDLNLTIVPNPELFAVQRASRIAGLFVPGVGHLAGRAVGAAVHIGSSVNTQNSTTAYLDTANRALFHPSGLHVSVLQTAQLQSHVGGAGRATSIGYGLDRLAPYAGRVAVVDSALPELVGAGRQDGMASWAASSNDRRTAKAERKAQRAMDRGRMRKVDRLENGALWLVVTRL